MFIPIVFRCNVSPAERNLFSLWAHMGGLDILNPKQANESSYSVSIIQAIKGKETLIQCTY